MISRCQAECTHVAVCMPQRQLHGLSCHLSLLASVFSASFQGLKLAATSELDTVFRLKLTTRTLRTACAAAAYDAAKKLCLRLSLL